MNSTPRFTVIIAGYQTAPYLPKSLTSVKQQRFADFEAICYVEESTDDSLAICQRFAANDPRFKIATGSKSGAVATTRNYGIDHATGEYLVVLDGDDWIVPDMLEKLDTKLRQTGEIDVLAFAAVTTESDMVDIVSAPRLTNFRKSDEVDVFTGLEAIRRTGRNGGSIHNYTWLNIYHTAFLREHHLYQSDGLMMEDFEHIPRVWFAAGRFAYLDEALYIYRRRPGSVTTQLSTRLLSELGRQMRSFMDFTARNDIPEDILRIWSNQWLAVLYWFLFHPVSSHKITNADRRRVLAELFANGGRARFHQLAARTSLPRRLATPLVYMAAAGWQFPAKQYFRSFYYPLTKYRQKKQGHL